jgi:chromosome segregation protein
MSNQARTQTEIESLTASVDNVEAQLTEARQRLHSLSEQRDKQVGTLEQIQQEEAQRRATLAEVEEKRLQATSEREAKAGELRAIQEEWRGLREKNSSLEARLASLRELRETYEGFAAGVRAIMRAKADGVAEAAGVIGPIGDLVSVEKQYERAIEAALGGSINNVVVDNGEAAKASIQFLKHHAAGRVTFLPLDMIRGGRREDTASWSDQPGIIGAAIDFVEYEARLEKAVEYLFHDTVLVQTLDDAIRIARSLPKYPRLVTLDGEVVSPSGTVTGGRVRHESRGLLGRSTEIEELERKIEAVSADIARSSHSQQELNAVLNELAERLKNLEEQESSLHTELNDMGVAVARHTTELENLAETSRALTARREALSAERDRLEQRRRDAATRADDLATDEQAIQQQMAEAQQTASRARESLSICADELADLRVRQAGLDQSAEEVERDKHRLERDLHEALAEADRREKLVAQLQQEQTDHENKIALSLERSRALSEDKEQARAKVVEAENQRQRLLEEGDATDTQLREVRTRGSELQSNLHQLELDLRQSEDRVGFFQERIASEYSVALSTLTADDVGTDEHDEDSRNEMVAQLRTRLQRMGEVNLTAIEEYEELEKRDEFLVAQSDDLRQAREHLLGVIERSDRKIRDMFMDTFRRVEETFHTYFRQLFNGGQARIYLLDEDDPLESGIEIEARPPGKKLQSISLLSGGESALTAIALLFSIFKAKPSPFCVLDEVDAPLDDANIGRFLSLLEEFADNSQFVIITHNKQTMTRAQVLYGITMQERGVSQLVSVRLDEVRDTETAA